MATKYNRQKRRTRKTKRTRNYKKMRGGALSDRTVKLLQNQYNGVNNDTPVRPNILELNEFLIENNIPESFKEVMDNIADIIGGILSPLPEDLTDAQRAEAARLHELMY